jgi:hypothetical protein
MLTLARIALCLRRGIPRSTVGKMCVLALAAGPGLGEVNETRCREPACR